jgi:hypothetical protein
MGEAGSRNIRVGVKDWRAQNPKATFSEIEEYVDETLADLRVKMMEDVALASRVKDIAALQEGEHIPCTICGDGIKDKGSHIRNLITLNGKQVHLERSYGYCSTCMVGFFPPR